MRSIIWALTVCVALVGCSGSRSADEAADPPAASKKACTVDPPKEQIYCTQQYDPVCGCNGKTYGNACTARAAGVSDFTPGACDDKPARD